MRKGFTYCALIAFSSFAISIAAAKENAYNAWAQTNAVNINGSQDQQREAAYKKAWSGSRKAVEEIAKEVEEKFAFELRTQHGRNVASILPVSRQELKREKDSGNGDWERTKRDGYHHPGHNPKKGDGIWKAIKLSGKDVVDKEVNSKNDEGVYNVRSGNIVMNEKMGTKNIGGNWLEHFLFDMNPHSAKRDVNDRFSVDGDQYKYVGILIERDVDDPDKYYIIDGQTGLPMTPEQVKTFPTTLSDMFKDKGFVCVKEDGIDMIERRNLFREDMSDFILDFGLAIPINKWKRKLQRKKQAEAQKVLQEAQLKQIAEEINKRDSEMGSDDQEQDVNISIPNSQSDLHSLNLDDPNGDWCKCEERGEKPGCKANMDPVKGYVFFGCTKCKKVNVKYAKMALELEQKMKDAGVQGTWFGQNAKENAHKAASEPGK